MDKKIRKIITDNINHLRGTAYQLLAGTLTTNEIIDIVNELREPISEMIEGIALENERLLKKLEEKNGQLKKEI